MILSLLSCGGEINTVGDSRFDADGYFIGDSDSVKASAFELKSPTKIKFFVEVSGSMNGFFRSNRPTSFKADLWNILSYCSPIAPKVCVLTNEGNEGGEMAQSQFQTSMNTGAFVSSASTKVPVMLQTIISSIDADAGEVAVLVSDMKYSPVGSAAPQVLLTQYSTDINKIIGGYGKAVSLVCAISNYLDTNGNEITQRSPYYYLIVGDGERVGEMRNIISTLLEQNGHFIDNIESGFNYSMPCYSFGIPKKCVQMENEPTFVQYEEADNVDTCTVKLKVDLKNYRWLMSDEKVFEKAFRIKALYGSEVKVGGISIETENIVNKELKRKSIATVELKVSNMAMDSEVLEWTLELPDTTRLSEFLCNATSESDPTKSYSVLDFIKGIFCGGVVNKELKPNYILISKKG